MIKALVLKFVLFFSLSSIVFAEATSPHSRFGIGVRYTGPEFFSSSKLEYTLKFYFSRKIDFVLGMNADYSKNAEYKIENYPVTLGLGYNFLTHRALHLKLLTKFRGEFTRTKRFGLGIGLTRVGKQQINLWAFEPACGAEYFLSGHFSLVPEIFLRYGGKWENWTDYYDFFTGQSSGSRKTTIFRLGGSLSLFFYF